jgi:hypothetical protein
LLGVRYRYYVSHALLQQRKAEAGSIARVPAPEIEALVLYGVRKHRASIGEVEHPTTIADRDLIERHVDSVIVKPQALEVRLVPTSEASVQTEEPSINDSAPRQLPDFINAIDPFRTSIDSHRLWLRLVHRHLTADRINGGVRIDKRCIPQDERRASPRERY